MKRWCVVCSLRQASVYCKNDDAYLCNCCDETIHSSNCFAARHERVRVCELCVDALATTRCTNEDALLCDACDMSVHSNPAAMNHERSAISNDADTAVCPDGRQTVAATPSGESTSNPSASALVDVSKGEGATSRSCSHEISQDSSVDLAVPGAGIPPVAQVIPSWDDLCQLDWSKPGGSSKFDFFKDEDVPEIESAWADRLDMGFDIDELLVGLDGDSEDSIMPATVEVAKEEDSAEKKEETTPAASEEASLPLPASNPATPTQEQAVAPGPSQLPAAAPTVPALVAPLTALPTAMTPFLGTAFASTMAATPLPGLIDPAALMTCPQAFALPYPGALSMLQPSGMSAPVVASPSKPVMDRAARVARYREKRKHRKFQKTIRYQSRKAYAEIRPRIKGRFATKSEVAAMKAAGTLPLPLPEDDVQVVPDAAS